MAVLRGKRRSFSALDPTFSREVPAARWAATGGRGLARKEKVPVFDQAGLGQTFAGQNLRQQAVIGGHIDPARGRADGQGSPVRTDSGIDHGHNHGAGGEGAGGLSEKVRSRTDIKDRAIVGKVEKFGRWVDGFYRALELAHIRIVDPEIRVESHEIAHLGTRLASGEPGGKQCQEEKGRPHGYLVPAEVCVESISSQNLGLPASSSSSERGSWDRKAKSLREFLWSTR